MKRLSLIVTLIFVWIMGGQGHAEAMKVRPPGWCHYKRDPGVAHVPVPCHWQR